MTPSPPHPQAPTAVPSTALGLTFTQWDISLELEAVLEYCFKIKEAVEFKSYLTGAQAYILFWDLKKGNHRSVPLMVKPHPPTAKGGDRKRKEEKRPARDLAFLTEETKRILVDAPAGGPLLQPRGDPMHPRYAPPPL